MEKCCWLIKLLPTVRAVTNFEIFSQSIHCKWKKMDDMKVMFVFIRVMLADVSYVPVNESYHYKMAFGLCAWKQT